MILPAVELIIIKLIISRLIEILGFEANKYSIYETKLAKPRINPEDFKNIWTIQILKAKHTFLKNLCIFGWFYDLFNLASHKLTILSKKHYFISN